MTLLPSWGSRQTVSDASRLAHRQTSWHRVHLLFHLAPVNTTQIASRACDPVPLPNGVRLRLEKLFGADLGSIRLHTASAPAAALGARAFARGDEIHFAPGEYDPFSREGWRVLGHEVAHVIQQRCGRVPGGSGTVPLDDALLEREARIAGVFAVAMYDCGRAPACPLYDVAIPSRHFGARAVQCLMDETAFKTATTAPGPRDKIAVIDKALAKYNALDKVKPRDYAKLLTQLRALFQACNTYKQQRPDSKRTAGVNALMKQIAKEEVVLVPLAAYYQDPDPVRKFEHLETAQELVLKIARDPDYKRAEGTQELIDLINANANVLSDAGAAAAAVQRDIDELRKLADRDTLPKVLKAVIKECTAVANTRQLDMKINRPGLMYNTANGATQKYVLNHATEQYLGKKFRMGSLLHELTHCSIAETFNNTCVMLAIKPTATDAEMLALARSRNAKIARLQSLLSSSTMDPQLKGECIDKAGYATGTKFASYVGAFKKCLGDAMVARLRNLISQGMASELVEYDTVINQMALWCHLWDVPENEPAYAELLSLVHEAALYRSSHRHMSKPLPVPPVRPVAAQQPGRKPLPPLPARSR